MINELHLLWVLNFKALGLFFIFETKFSWNEFLEGIVNYCNVEYVVTIRYLVVTACYLVFTGGYLYIGGYWWLLVVTAC